MELQNWVTNRYWGKKSSGSDDLIYCGGHSVRDQAGRYAGDDGTKNLHIQILQEVEVTELPNSVLLGLTEIAISWYKEKMV